jgi:hypothetical protein
MEVEQFPGGHSNLTYLLRFGTQEFVCVARRSDLFHERLTMWRGNFIF